MFRPADEGKTRAVFTASLRLALLATASAVYIALPALLDAGDSSGQHFTELAYAFLQGKLAIEVTPQALARGLATEELIPSPIPGHFYCAYPPLPAVLLLPFVTIFGPAIRVAWACRIVSTLNVLLFDACLARLPQRLGWQRLNLLPRAMLDLFFAFGTSVWHVSLLGGDWHLAHAVALAALLLAMREWAAADRPLVVGCCSGLAILARPTCGLTALFFLLPLLRARAWRAIALFVIGPLVAVCMLGGYNQARFGTPLDFGYDRMLLTGAGRDLMARYGQFDLHFVATNFFRFFLAPPWPLAHGRFPFLGYDPYGLSLFLASPAMLYALVGVWRGYRLPFVRDAAAGIGACLVPLLLYFNTGFGQFGHRFSMDYLPLLMVLVLAGMGPRPSRLAYGLLSLSIAIHGVAIASTPITQIPAWLRPPL